MGSGISKALLHEELPISRAEPREGWSVVGNARDTLNLRRFMSHCHAEVHGLPRTRPNINPSKRVCFLRQNFFYLHLCLSLGGDGASRYKRTNKVFSGKKYKWADRGVRFILRGDESLADSKSYHVREISK